MDYVEEEWKSWCRLCAKVDVKNNQIFSECVYPRYNSETHFIDVINENFHAQITKGDDLPQVVCIDCLSTIDSLVEFNARVRKVQEMYTALQYQKHSGILDLHLFSEKYGVLQDVSPIMRVSNASHIFQTKTTTSNSVTCDSPSSGYTKPLQAEIIGEAPLKGMNAELATISKCKGPIGAGIKLYSPESLTKAGVIEREKSHDKKYQDNSSGSDCVMLELGKEQFNTNRNKSRYVCSNCQRSFLRISSYRSHIRKEHSHIKNIPIIREEQVFTCPNCNQIFSRKTLMSQHIKTTHGDKTAFVCEECGEIVGSRTAFRDHKFTHTNYAPFECKVCGRRFKQESRLKKHMDIHGDKHICDECGLQLSSRATLYCHSLVHSDVMPHKCDYCGRAFKRSKTLKNHLILHTGLKPYTCDFCDKTFSNSTSCRTHKKNMHPKEFAAQEASGVKPSKAKNIPKLEVLKAVTRTAKDLTPVAPKLSGNFSFGNKPKFWNNSSNVQSINSEISK